MRNGSATEDGQKRNENPWMTRARNAFEMSTTYFDANYRENINDAILMFNNQHPNNSKYRKPKYAYRSKLFRPKTRSAIRKNEAAATAAFFSGIESYDISALNEKDEESVISADMMKELVNYRLNHTLPWFQTCIGALQDAQKTGVVCSYNHWVYKTIRRKEPELDENGEQIIIEGKPQFRVVKEVVKDQPEIELVPIENIRFHPGADWRNPIESSPFLIQQIPMYVDNVLQKMKDIDDKTGESVWVKYSMKEIEQCAINDFDSTYQARNSLKQDGRQETVPEFNEYSMVWIHRNIVQVSGRDYVYYSLGARELLTKPKPIEEEYWHGNRPYTFGCCILETHKTIPQGTAELGSGLQEEANEIVNQRLDNIYLALNKRWLAKRGQQIDLQSLMRNVAGSVTMVNNTDDIIPVEFQDVTSSSYQEQDRVNLDHDELIGNFSAGSVQSNRSLNETVGGMGMLQSGAGLMSDYLLRTFSETWLEPTLRQLVDLEAKYESDELILQIAMDKADVIRRYGKTPEIDELLKKQISVKVDVGLGASNPQFRMERFMFAVDKLSQVAANAPPQLDIYEISKELWSYLGYKSGDRFMTFDESNDDPKYQQMTQMIEQLQQALAEAQKGTEEKFRLEELKQDNENIRHHQKITADLIQSDLKVDGEINRDALKAFAQQERSIGNK